MTEGTKIEFGIEVDRKGRYVFLQIFEKRWRVAPSNLARLRLLR